MKIQERFLWVLLAAMIVGSGACRHKPAYSDIDANKASRNQNQNGESQASSAQPAPAESPAATAPQPSPAAPQRPSFQSPSFLDPTRGGIKDLPSYPNAQRVHVQIGVVQGVNTATLVFNTGDPMDRIAAFFDQAIKNSPWTVDVTYTSGDNKDKTMPGIYEIDGDTCKVCFAPVDKERPTDFEAKEGTDCVVTVWKREKK